MLRENTGSSYFSIFSVQGERTRRSSYSTGRLQKNWNFGRGWTPHTRPKDFRRLLQYELHGGIILRVLASSQGKWRTNRFEACNSVSKRSNVVPLFPSRLTGQVRQCFHDVLLWFSCLVRCLNSLSGTPKLERRPLQDVCEQQNLFRLHSLPCSGHCAHSSIST